MSLSSDLQQLQPLKGASGTFGLPPFGFDKRPLQPLKGASGTRHVTTYCNPLACFNPSKVHLELVSRYWEPDIITLQPLKGASGTITRPRPARHRLWLQPLKGASGTTTAVAAIQNDRELQPLKGASGTRRASPTAAR